jgi:DNA-binding response OmpR family regulator
MRVLVAEDEFLLADDLSTMLREQGAIVVGPAPTLEKAEALLQNSDAVDAAVLDINLRDILVYPVARA